MVHSVLTESIPFITHRNRTISRAEKHSSQLERYAREDDRSSISQRYQFFAADPSDRLGLSPKYQLRLNSPGVVYSALRRYLWNLGPLLLMRYRPSHSCF